MTFISGCWQREDIIMTSYILNLIVAWSRYQPRSGHGLGSYPEYPICITGDWTEPQTGRRGSGWKSTCHVVAMPYTPMKLLCNTLQLPNISEENLRPQYLSTSVNIVTSILSSLHSGIRIGLINYLWARGIGRTSGTAGWVKTLVSQLWNLSPWMFIRLLFCRRTLPRRISWLKNTVLCHMSILTLGPAIRRVLLSHCTVRMVRLRMPLMLLTNLFWSNRSWTTWRI